MAEVPFSFFIYARSFSRLAEVQDITDTRSVLILQHVGLEFWIGQSRDH